VATGGRPSEVFVAFVLLQVTICMACANDLEAESTRSRKFLPPRRKVAKFSGERWKLVGLIFIRNLRPLRPLRLCGRYSEIWLSLCRAGFFVVRSFLPIPRRRKLIVSFVSRLIALDAAMTYNALNGEFTIGIDSRRSSPRLRVQPLTSRRDSSYAPSVVRT